MNKSKRSSNFEEVVVVVNSSIYADRRLNVQREKKNRSSTQFLLTGKMRSERSGRIKETYFSNIDIKVIHIVKVCH